MSYHRSLCNCQCVSNLQLCVLYASDTIWQLSCFVWCVTWFIYSAHTTHPDGQAGYISRTPVSMPPLASRVTLRHVTSPGRDATSTLSTLDVGLQCDSPLIWSTAVYGTPLLINHGESILKAGMKIMWCGGGGGRPGWKAWVPKIPSPNVGVGNQIFRSHKPFFMNYLPKTALGLQLFWYLSYHCYSSNVLVVMAWIGSGQVNRFIQKRQVGCMCVARTHRPLYGTSLNTNLWIVHVVVYLFAVHLMLQNTYPSSAYWRIYM